MRIACKTCGYAALAPGTGEERCPNCGSVLRRGPRLARRARDASLAPRARDESVEAPGATPDEIRAWADAHSHVPVDAGHGRLLVEVVRRLPPPGGYRDPAEVRESIRIRHRMRDWMATAVHVMSPAFVVACGLVLAGMGSLAGAALLAGSLVAALGIGAREIQLRRGALEFGPERVVVATSHSVAARQVRAVRQGDDQRGRKIVLELDDGESVVALRWLSAHQADYVEELLRDVLRLRA